MKQADCVVDRCDSTNDLARELGEAGAAHGTWISTRVQAKGRGRLGREWQSAEGNLFLSLVARIEDKTRWTWVPLATAAGVARFCAQRFPDLPLRIKWPNDLWVVAPGALPGAAGAKLGGILCEAVGNRAGSFIVVGLGLNCRYAPQGLDQRTISLSGALGLNLVADDVRADLILSIRSTLDELATVGPQKIIEDFAQIAAFPPGSSVEWTGGGDASPAVKNGVVRGLGSSGELLVTLPDGTETKLYAEDVKVRSTR